MKCMNLYCDSHDPYCDRGCAMFYSLPVTNMKYVWYCRRRKMFNRVHPHVNDPIAWIFKLERRKYFKG